jgi:hypothetical protein
LTQSARLPLETTLASAYRYKASSHETRPEKNVRRLTPVTQSMTTRFNGTVEVGNARYGWNFKRAAQASYDGLTGHSLYVFVEDGSGRDLILDFAYGELGSTDRTYDHSAIVSALRECIPLALRAGWAPARRGKPLRLDATALRESGGNVRTP